MFLRKTFPQSCLILSQPRTLIPIESGHPTPGKLLVCVCVSLFVCAGPEDLKSIIGSIFNKIVKQIKYEIS